MIKIIILMILSSATLACELSFTKEQENKLYLAYITGYKYDRGHTLAAIIWKESFVGDHIIRTNSKDGKYGSFGIAHMQLTTAMELLGYKSSWKARAELVPLMIMDDRLSLDLAMMYLNRSSHLSWRTQISRYNGKGPKALRYAEEVSGRALLLSSCNFFKEIH